MGAARRPCDSPSTVMTLLPATVAISRAHANAGSPSISTMQAPHCSVPQPNRLPRNPSSSRSTDSSGVVAIGLDVNGLAVDDEVVSPLIPP